MNNITYCHRCGRILNNLEEIHASEGMLFCSVDCVVTHYTDEIIANAKEQAKQLCNEYSEVITPQDIGLA